MDAVNCSTSPSDSMNTITDRQFSTINSSELSQPSSPCSSVHTLPSPPDSPLPSPSTSDSISSLPSVSSSFFFSSAAASPPHSAQRNHDDHEELTGLVIPSLTLPSPLKRSSSYGQTIGNLRLLVVGSSKEHARSIIEALLDDNEDVVEVGLWSREDVLSASTDWIEKKDAHGLERYEGRENVEFVCVCDDDREELLHSLTNLIEAPFRSLSAIIHPDYPPTDKLSALLAGSNTPLFTALVLCLSSPPSQTDLYLIKHLGSQIPVVILPSSRSRSSSTSISPHPSNTPSKKHILPKGTLLSLSSLQPRHPQALRASLFRSPETLAALRMEGVERFLRWREVRRALGSSSLSSPFAERITGEKEDLWVEWSESEREEWGGRLSYDVAAARERAQALGGKEAAEKAKLKGRGRDDTVTQRTFTRHQPLISRSSTYSPPCSRSHSYSTFAPIPAISFDPLHFPSLVMFGLSLFRPAVSKQVRGWRWKWRWEVGVALVGGFCLGMLASSR